MFVSTVHLRDPVCLTGEINFSLGLAADRPAGLNKGQRKILKKSVAFSFSHITVPQWTDQWLAQWLEGRTRD